MHMTIPKIGAYALAFVLAGTLSAGIVLADDISNNLDTSIDAIAETMSLTAGGANGATAYAVRVQNGDGKNGCNITGGKVLNVSVISSSPAVTVSPTSLTFTSCGSVPAITVTPVSAGSATVTLAVAGGTTATGTFNLAPATFTVNVAAPADVTAPVIAGTLSPEPNAAGWNNADVTVNWFVTDGESAIAASTGCDAVTVAEETAGTVLTCTATSAGGTATQSVTVKIDKTKPVIAGSRTPEANAYGWNNTGVTVNFACAEGGSVQSGIDSDTVAGTLLASDGADQSVGNTGACTDVAGNVADAAAVTGISIDTVNPTVTIVAPANGVHYVFKQAVLADWSVTDALSGVDIATATVPAGQAIDTATTGVKTFGVNVTDRAGNGNAVTVSYTVDPYVFGGLSAPLSITAKDFKKTSTIPVKFQLLDSHGGIVADAVATLTVNGGAATASGSSNIGNFFRYDPIARQYIYNLSTKSLGMGSNTLTIALNDGTAYSKTITIK